MERKLNVFFCGFATWIEVELSSPTHFSHQSFNTVDEHVVVHFIRWYGNVFHTPLQIDQIHGWLKDLTQLTGGTIVLDDDNCSQAHK